MAKKTASSKKEDPTIAQNRKARHDYEILETFEAGVVLQGWEVKSIRDGKAGIAESYVIIKHDEAWVLGMQITPLLSASTHVTPSLDRTRKLLLHKKEIQRLKGKVEQKGFTLVALNMYWSKGNVKLLVGLAKGKKTHDKRQTIKEREWQRDKARILKKG